MPDWSSEAKVASAPRRRLSPALPTTRFSLILQSNTSNPWVICFGTRLQQGNLVEPNLGALTRSCRSLRSSAAYMGYAELAKRCEEVDGQLELIRSQAAAPRPIIERLQCLFEGIKASFSEVEAPRNAVGQMTGVDVGAASEAESVKPGTTGERRSTGGPPVRRGAPVRRGSRCRQNHADRPVNA